MLLLGLDLETTGLDPEKDLVIEIGAVLWDTEAKQPVRLFSEMVLEKPDLALPKEIEELTGIQTLMLHRFGKAPDDLFFSTLASLFAQADGCVAHNAAFDRGFLTRFYRRWGRELPEKTWICTVLDVDYPRSVSSKSLVYLSAVHGFVNPFSHRAVTDVLSMFKVLSHYKIEEVWANASSPKVELVALVSYENRQLAKDLGFRWDGSTKKWKKQMRAHLFDPKALPFEVEKTLVP